MNENNYKSEENAEKDERNLIIIEKKPVDANIKETRKEKVIRIIKNNKEHPFIEELSQLFIHFEIIDEHLDALNGLIVNCPDNDFYIYIIKLMNELVKEDDAYLVFLMNEKIIAPLNESIVSGLPYTKECIGELYALYKRAVDGKIFKEIPPFVLELPMNLSIYLESDTHAFLGTQRSASCDGKDENFTQLLISLNQISLRFLNDLLTNDLIHEPSVIEELYEKYFYFLKLPIGYFKATALRGISLLSIKNQEVSFACLSKNATDLFSFLNPRCDKEVCSNTLDIFVNLSASENNELIGGFLSRGLLSYLSLKNRDDEFIDSLCTLATNLLISSDEIAEFFMESKIMKELSELFVDSSFASKCSIIGTFCTLMNTRYSIDFFSEIDILGAALEVFRELSKEQQNILAQGLIKLYEELQVKVNPNLTAELTSDEFIEALEDASEEENAGENVTRLLEILCPDDGD